ncbi:MAG: UDP-N-acetylmuramoyl-L-alanyl-D-glutamate--2,6-diaminopimelate ligase [Bacteroidota bacterium]|nr:UDP-N-acetylmuramoyl-L-alanyl-D-glutamate--2,6-diaminopimelate ligase [Bacteroidota bacterium]
MILLHVISGAKTQEIIGSTELVVDGMALDSRFVKPGYLFAALTGTQVDGHNYIQTALDLGAKVILCSILPSELNADITFIVSKNCSVSLALMAKNFYGNPASYYDLVAVTGTNGKTTTCTLLYQLFTQLGYKCGLISTAGNFIAEKSIPATHTTPDVLSLNALLAEMRDAELDFVFMEASSHAIHQNRTYGLPFKLAAFTNLTHDHLDYHGTFADYRDAKKALFDQLDSEAWALTNADDKNGKIMLQNSEAMRSTYGLSNTADFKAKVIENDLYGMVLELDGMTIHTRISGLYNAYNITCVYAIARLLGMEANVLAEPISNLIQVNGRFNIIHVADRIAIVDYAHTPDALLNVLKNIEEVNVHGKKVYTVIGCGGDRDTSKRPQMAKIAVEHSYKVVFTSDNPRTENPETILDNMESGLSASAKAFALRITDRKQAIRTAVSLSSIGDIILIAGKGHETYQEINGVKYPFDDKVVVFEELSNLVNNSNK